MACSAGKSLTSFLVVVEPQEWLPNATDVMPPSRLSLASAWLEEDGSGGKLTLGAGAGWCECWGWGWGRYVAERLEDGRDGLVLGAAQKGHVHVAAERGRAGRQRQKPSADGLEERPAHEAKRQRLHDGQQSVVVKVEQGKHRSQRAARDSGGRVPYKFWCCSLPNNNN